MENITLEIERKFILSALPDFTPDQVLSIMQFYTENARYRAATDVHAQRTVYYKTVKTLIEPGVNREDEHVIAPRDFFSCMRKVKKGLNKIRYVYKEKKLKFEVDVFAHRPDLILLEIELPSKEYEVEIPLWIKQHLVEEVTGQPWYNNFELAVAI